MVNKKRKRAIAGIFMLLLGVCVVILFWVLHNHSQPQTGRDDLPFRTSEVASADTDDLPDDVVIARVNEETILRNDIDEVFSYTYRDSNLSRDESKQKKAEILENGINEIVAIYEGQSMGLEIDISAAEALAEQLKHDSPDIYALIEEQMGMEQYISDLAKSNLIREVKGNLLQDYDPPSITDEDLYSWYCDQLELLGQSQKIVYNDFLDNKDYAYRKWKEQCENDFFTEWIMEKRKNYQIEYVSPIE